MAEIWDKVNVSDLKAGDWARNVVKFTGGATQTIEGEIEFIERTPVGTFSKTVGVPYEPWSEELMDAIDTIENFRRRPEVKLPTMSGSAVLIRHPGMLEDRVLTLTHTHGWVDADDGVTNLDLTRIERYYVQTLFDAGAAFDF